MKTIRSLVLGALIAVPLYGETPRQGRERQAPPNQGFAMEYIRELLTFRKELGLSSAQVETIRQVRADALRGAAKERAAMQSSQQELTAFLGRPKPDFAGARAAGREITEGAVKIQVGISVDAYEKAYNTLTDAQKEKLAALRAERRTATVRQEMLYGNREPGRDQ